LLDYFDQLGIGFSLELGAWDLGFINFRYPGGPRAREGASANTNLLRSDSANLLFVGSPDCVLPDASGKFFAHF
jgi:hypothetical protein